MKPSPFPDDLTAVVTRPCFLCLGEHYVQFSRLTRVPLLLASIEISELPKETAEDREARDLLSCDVLAPCDEPRASAASNDFGVQLVERPHARDAYTSA